MFPATQVYTPSSSEVAEGELCSSVSRYNIKQNSLARPMEHFFTLCSLPNHSLAFRTFAALIILCQTDISREHGLLRDEAIITFCFSKDAYG